MFHLPPNRKFRKFWVNGKRPKSINCNVHVYEGEIIESFCGKKIVAMITLAGNLTLTFLWPKSVANAQEVFAAQTRFQISCVTRTGSRTMNDCLSKRPVPCNVSEPHECHALLQSILLRLRYILYDYQRSSRPSLQERKSERVFLFLLLVVFSTMCQGDHFLWKIIWGKIWGKRSCCCCCCFLFYFILYCFILFGVKAWIGEKISVSRLTVTETPPVTSVFI